MPRPAEIVLQAIAALEARDLDRLHALYDPAIRFHWQPGLPYGGDHHGAGVRTMTEVFARTWAPLQPDAETRRMDPRVVATDGEDVVINYCWRGRKPDGTSFATDTLAHYRVRDNRLIDARMYYFDLTGLLAFIGDAPR